MKIRVTKPKNKASFSFKGVSCSMAWSCLCALSSALPAVGCLLCSPGVPTNRNSLWVLHLSVFLEAVGIWDSLNCVLGQQFVA